MSILSNPGGSGTVSTATGGKIYAYNTITSANNVPVVAANPQRRKITFHNPSDVDILISPTQSFNGSVFATLTPTNAAKGGGFTVFGNGGTLIIEGECQQAWQALAASGSGKALTVMDTNV